MSEQAVFAKYLADVDEPRRLAIERIVNLVKSAVSDVVEVTSYGMPALAAKNGILLGLLATKEFASLYPFSGSVLLQMSAELQGYTQTKGALHLRPDRPLAEATLRRLIELRLAELSHQN